MRLAALVVLLLLPAGGASAQEVRPFSTFRQLHGEARLAVDVEYAAGVLRLGPGRPGELYRMELAYDDERYAPVSRYDAARGAVRLGLRSTGTGGLRVLSRRRLRQEAAILLSPRVDLDLDLALGAADAEVELGGLRVASLRLSSGASEAVVRFSRPNGRHCGRAEFNAGAAEIAVLGLGNSRCDEIRFEGGVGKVTLDFGGTWSSSARVAVTMAVGELTLRLPRGVGVRLAMDRFLSSFEPTGLVRREGGYETADYRLARRRLDLTLTAAVGGIEVEWTAAEVR